jgi:hypothetical protein
VACAVFLRGRPRQDLPRRPNELLSTGNDKLALWIHYQELAGDDKNKMIATASWLLGLAVGLLAVCVGELFPGKEGPEEIDELRDLDVVDLDWWRKRRSGPTLEGAPTVTRGVGGGAYPRGRGNYQPDSDAIRPS